MENREDNLFGKKVFFLNPTLMIENNVVSRLREMEYEIYIIRDYRDAKPILSEYENSLCFINIDDELSYKEWFNFVKSFEYDSSLESIFLGILSAKAKPEVKEQFVLKTKLPGGFVNISDHLEIVINTIEKILDLNGAKGRRKFIRLDCEGSNTVTATSLIGDKMVDYKLQDLSIAGFAARISPNMAPLFEKGRGIGGISIKLGIRSVSVDVTVFAVKNDGRNCVVVFLLSPNTHIRILDEIRKFIHKSLQAMMDSLVDSTIKDLTDYTIDVVPPVSVQESLPLSGSPDDLKFEELGDLEDFDIGLDI